MGRIFIICSIIASLYGNSCGFPFRNKRLTLADSASNEFVLHDEIEGPGTYAFNYDIEEPDTGNIQFRTEERSPNGTVTGSYGFVSPEGSIHIVHYTADHLGYRARIEDSHQGQLKKSQFGYYGKQDNSVSPEMQAAMNSLQNYNPQHRSDIIKIRTLTAQSALHQKAPCASVTVRILRKLPFKDRERLISERDDNCRCGERVILPCCHFLC